MTTFSGSWINVLPAKTDTGPTQGMIRITPGGLTFPVIFEGYQVALHEKVQFLEAFKEFIHIYAFGKAVGQATLSGMVLATARNPLHRKFKTLLVEPYDNTLRAFKLAKSGNLATISGPGSNIVKGVVTSLSYQIQAPQSSVIRFNMDLAIVSSALGVT